MSDAPLAVVTGAPGWLGSRLVRALGDDRPPRRIRCLVQPGVDPSPLGAGIETVPGEIDDPEAARRLMEGAAGATVFHLCGIIHPRRIRELRRINVEGTRNVLEAAARSGVRRFVAVSSNSPAGFNPSREHRFTEEDPPNPYMAYGRSKWEMEGLVRAAGDALETVVLRPCWFYGPEQPARQTLFFTMIKEGRAPLVGDGGDCRSMSYVDNTCQGLLLAERVPQARGRTYWIADERPYPMREILDTVERLLETEFSIPVAHRRLRIPSWACDAARAADRALQGLGLYHAKVHVLSEMNRTIACSVDRARRELGYAPAVALEEGMRRSIRWCLDRGIRI